MELLLRPWRHYADFWGRSRRGEYWLFVLQLIVFDIIISILDVRPIFDPRTGVWNLTQSPSALINLLGLVFIIPGIAVGVRRLHDAGLTGWLILISLVPLLGWLIMLVLTLLPPNNSTNAYGPDPRDPSASMDELSRTFS